jgi:hypothetical protein
MGLLAAVGLSPALVADGDAAEDEDGFEFNGSDAAHAGSYKRHDYTNPPVRRDNTRPVFGSAESEGARTTGRLREQGESRQPGFAAPTSSAGLAVTAPSTA